MSSSSSTQAPGMSSSRLIIHSSLKLSFVIDNLIIWLLKHLHMKQYKMKPFTFNFVEFDTFKGYHLEYDLIKPGFHIVVSDWDVPASAGI